MPVGSLKAFCSFEHLFLLVSVFSIANFAVMTHKNNDNISHAVSLSYFESCYHKILHTFLRRIYRTAAPVFYFTCTFLTRQRDTIRNICYFQQQGVRKNVNICFQYSSYKLSSGFFHTHKMKKTKQNISSEIFDQSYNWLLGPRNS